MGRFVFIPEPRPRVPPEADTGLPKGFRKVEASVYIDENGRFVITTEPSEVWPEPYDDEHPHNCDAAGCGWEHVVARGRVEDSQ